MPESTFMLELIYWQLIPTTRILIFVFVLKLQGEPDLASGSDVNGSTESFEMVIEEATADLATKQKSSLFIYETIKKN